MTIADAELEKVREINRSLPFHDPIEQCDE